MKITKESLDALEALDLRCVALLRGWHLERCGSGFYCPEQKIWVGKHSWYSERWHVSGGVQAFFVCALEMPLAEAIRLYGVGEA